MRSARALSLGLALALLHIACGERVEIGSDALPHRPPPPPSPPPCEMAACGEPCMMPGGMPPGSPPSPGLCDGHGACVIDPICPDPPCIGRPCGTDCGPCMPGQPNCPPAMDAGLPPPPDGGPPPPPMQVCDIQRHCVTWTPELMCPP